MQNHRSRPRKVNQGVRRMPADTKIAGSSPNSSRNHRTIKLITMASIPDLKAYMICRSVLFLNGEALSMAK